MFRCRHIYLVDAHIYQVSLLASPSTVCHPHIGSLPHSWLFFCLILLLLLAGFILLLNELFWNRHSYSHPLQAILSHLFPEHLFITEPSHTLSSPISLFVTFQHASFRWNFFLLTPVERISWDDDWERLTPFPAERNSSSPWLIASFMPLSFTMSCLGKNKVRWFPVAFPILWIHSFLFPPGGLLCPIWYHTTP